MRQSNFDRVHKFRPRGLITFEFGRGSASKNFSFSLFSSNLFHHCCLYQLCRDRCTTLGMTLTRLTSSEVSIVIQKTRSGALLFMVLIGCSPPSEPTQAKVLVHKAALPDAELAIVFSPPRDATVEAIDAAIRELLASERRLSNSTPSANQPPSNVTSLTLKGKP